MTIVDEQRAQAIRECVEELNGLIKDAYESGIYTDVYAFNPIPYSTMLPKYPEVSVRMHKNL